MLRNNLKISARMLARRKFYTAINVVGLSFGLAIVLLISLYVRFELSFEKDNPLADRLVRVTMDYLNGEAVIDQDAETYHPMAPRMLSEFSEIENFARAYPGKFSRSKSGVLLRKVLVIFQFAITVFLLIQTVTAERQLTYMREKVGLSAEQTIVIRSAANMSGENYQVLKDKVLTHSRFASVALSHSVPGQPTSEMASTNVGVGLVGAAIRTVSSKP